MKPKMHENTGYLGVTLVKNLSWDEHTESLAVKASQCLDVLNAVKYKLDCKMLHILYFTSVRSKFEHTNIVWEPTFILA